MVDDPSIMFFTSGTTSYPKITTHNFKYPLGHYVTAKYWHQVDPDGIHFAISDTGWGKALWGKIYVSGCARHVFLPMILIISDAKEFFI